MATDVSFVIRGTLKNQSGTALASATVKAARLQSPAVAASLVDSTQTTADSFSASTDSNGIFSITCTHALAWTCPLTYKVTLPDGRYFLLPVGVNDGSRVFNVGTLLCESNPATIKDINITPLVQKNMTEGNAVYGTPSSLSTIRTEEQVVGFDHFVKMTFTNYTQALTDEAGVVAYGGTKIYDFPDGAIVWGGAVLDGALTKSSAGVNADWDGDVGLGTATASNNATLSSTEQDLIPTTATPQAVAGVTTCDALSTATEVGAVLDGTGTAKDMFLNFLVDDADHDVTGTACNLIVNGTLQFKYSVMGDK